MKESMSSAQMEARRRARDLRMKAVIGNAIPSSRVNLTASILLALYKIVAFLFSHIRYMILQLKSRTMAKFGRLSLGRILLRINEAPCWLQICF